MTTGCCPAKRVVHVAFAAALAACASARDAAKGPPPLSDAPAEAPPAYALAGYTKPALVQENCLQDLALARVHRAAPKFRGQMTVKFAVNADGTPSRFTVLAPGPDALQPGVDRIVEGAVRDCRWLPGKDAAGRPITIWVIAPLRFDVPGIIPG